MTIKTPHQLLVDVLGELGDEPSPSPAEAEKRAARERLGVLQDRLREMPGPSSEERAGLLVEVGDLRERGIHDHAAAMAAWEEAMRLGSVDAVERIAAVRESDEEGGFDAIPLRRRVVAADPGRIGSLRAMHRTFLALGAESEAAAIASVLSTFDSSFGGAVAPPPEAIREPPDGALAAIRPGGFDGVARVLGLIWEGAYTLLRKELSDFGAAPATRLSPLEDSPLARAFLFASRMLGLPKASVFVRPDRGAFIEVVATHPPCVIVGAGFQAETARARFVLGRAIEGTSGGLVLGLSTAPEEIDVLIQAVRIALGGTPGLATPRAMDLAPRLAKAMPPRVERALKDETLRTPLPDDARTWSTLVRKAANRAGLLVSGDAAACLRTLALEIPELDGVDVGTALGFQEAAARSAEFGDLVAFAVSEEYLALRWRSR